MQGHFITVRPEGEDENLYVSGAALAALPHTPRRGDRVQFRVAETRDGRRRAIDLVLTDEGVRE